MPASRPHILVEDLKIGWGSRVLMEHVTFEVAARDHTGDSRRIG